MITENAGMKIRVCLLGLVLFASPSVAMAQGGGNSPAPAAAGASTERAKLLIDRMRGVMRDVTTLRYDGESRVQMPDGKRIAASQTKVVAERIDAGGWKLLVDGTFGFESVDPKAEKKGNPQTVRAAWDGLILSALQEKRKVLRKTAPKDMDVVRLEMNQADAASTVAWDLFGNPPFGNLDSAQKIEFEESEKVNDMDCDVIWVVPAAGKNPPVPFRLFVAKKDGLPRRMEMFRPAAVRQTKEKRGEAGIVLSYSNVVGTPDSSGVSFEVELPKGFTVAADKNLPKEGDKPENDQPTPPPAPAPVVPTTTDAAPKYPLLPSHAELLNPGTNAPPFKLKDFAGKERSLEEFKGKVVVLDFWGTWCPPCRMAMPAVQKVHEKFADKGVVVLGMNFESNPKADPEKFKKDKGYTYTSLAKAETIAGSYKVTGWPTFYVIGKDGKVVWGGRALNTPPGPPSGESGAVDYLESNLTQAIEKALK
jgi:thiol-disulfide isomerase/thioredoxin